MTELRISGVPESLKEDLVKISKFYGSTYSAYIRMKLREIVDFEKRTAKERPRNILS